MSRNPSNSDWLVAIIIVGAVLGMGGGVKGCDASGTGGGNNPAPKTSQVCNEYFKGGC